MQLDTVILHEYVLRLSRIGIWWRSCVEMMMVHTGTALVSDGVGEVFGWAVA